MAGGPGLHWHSIQLRVPQSLAVKCRDMVRLWGPGMHNRFGLKSVTRSRAPALGAVLPLSESLLRLENVCNFAARGIHFSFH
jgi:hypothetical protein